MTTKELIYGEIDKLDDKALDDLYEFIKRLRNPNNIAQKTGLMAKLRQIRIDATGGFFGESRSISVGRKACLTASSLIRCLSLLLLINRDQYHQQASELSERFEGYPFLITDTVLLEIGNALARSYKNEAVDIITEFLDSEEVEIVHLTPQMFEQAFDLYKTYQDKEWGLIDCVSFVVMREKGVNQALTFDRHFIQAGFQVLMSESN